ncbi:MAG: YbjN domain-containing protein [Alphaproteobacteria bacterium]|nr:YbjN domain-containing protein [Alphaproteobacteria bacterium]
MNLAIKQNMYNPLDTIEHIFYRDNVSFDRRGNNELVAEVFGKWDNMLVFFAYEEHMRCLHISCLLNIETNSVDRSKMFELLALLNENLWLGHFSYWSEQKMPIFKHSMILQDEEELFTNKISKIIELSIMECERVYPIFNAVMRQNIQPSDALYREAMVM